MKKLTIIKVGGKIIKDPDVRNHFIKNFSIIVGYKMLIHGGGAVLDEFAKGINVETKVVNGRRITTEKILKLAVMIYAGLINKEIVSKLQSFGINAIGFTGADADIIRSSMRLVRNNVNYGLVGDIQKINVHLLNKLINNGYTIVFAPITHDGKGQLLNTNADSIAGEVSKILVCNYDIRLVYCLDKNGVLVDETDENSIIKELSYVDFQKYKKDGAISRGMLPKLENAFSALFSGVKEVVITCASDINCQKGTYLKL
ncbi:MAG: acetylglutamate kinase [Bacteroidales bacterium OttesenSCG-928-I14]|jgi:acetylglutamate kinase|nr:acetylglutamate kinase [Bacteroidales bacterium OttesenSCG-928-I14]